jgi:hypothetical protein
MAIILLAVFSAWPSALGLGHFSGFSVSTAVSWRQGCFFIMSTVELTRGTLSCWETEVVTSSQMCHSHFSRQRGLFLERAAGIPAGCWGTALQETAGLRRQSDGAMLGCRAFPRLTRCSPQHSRATLASGDRLHAPQTKGAPNNGCLRHRGCGHSLSPERRGAGHRRRCVRAPAPPPPRPPAARPRSQQAADDTSGVLVNY